jgi:hypothetical protein
MYVFLSEVIARITKTDMILPIPLIANLSSLLTEFHTISATVKRFLSKPTIQYIQENYAQLIFNQ